MADLRIRSSGGRRSNACNVLQSGGTRHSVKRDGQHGVPSALFQCAVQEVSLRTELWEVDSFVGERDFLLRTSDTYRSTVCTAFAFAALWRLQIEKSSHSMASTCCVSFSRKRLLPKVIKKLLTIAMAFVLWRAGARARDSGRRR